MHTGPYMVHYINIFDGIYYIYNSRIDKKKYEMAILYGPYIIYLASKNVFHPVFINK